MVRVSKITTINNQEYVPESGGIGFAPELVKLILESKKLSTYRFGKKYDHLNVGDTVRIEDSDTGKVACLARITNKSTINFADMPISGDTYESFRDKEHQRQVLNGYYAFLGRPISDGDEFLHFDFELVSD